MSVGQYSVDVNPKVPKMICSFDPSSIKCDCWHWSARCSVVNSAPQCLCLVGADERSGVLTGTTGRRYPVVAALLWLPPGCPFLCWHDREEVLNCTFTWHAGKIPVFSSDRLARCHAPAYHVCSQMITGSKESPLQYQNTRTRLNRNGNSNNFIATHPPLYLVTGRSVCVGGGGGGYWKYTQWYTCQIYVKGNKDWYMWH